MQSLLGTNQDYMRNLWIFALLFVLFCTGCVRFGQNKNITLHWLERRTDGGYMLVLRGTVRHIQPISAEGFFPVQHVYCTITLRGAGKDSFFRGQPGHYFSYPDDIESVEKYWDTGYAWVDKKRETIYLNFFWVTAPDSLIKSVVNGSYNIKP